MDTAGDNCRSSGKKGRDRRLSTGIPGSVRRGWRWWDIPAGAACAAFGAACGFVASYPLLYISFWLGWTPDPGFGWWRWYFIIGDRLIIATTSLSAFAVWLRYSRRDANARVRSDADERADPNSHGNPRPD